MFDSCHNVKRQSKSKRSILSDETKVGDGFALAAAKAGDNAATDSYATYLKGEQPSVNDLATIFTKCRAMAQSNYWLKMFLPLKFAVMNFGMQLSPDSLAGGKKKGSGNSDADVDALDAWFATEGLVAAGVITDPADIKKLGVPSGTPISNRNRVNKYIEDACNEFLILDNSIGYWDDAQGYPVTLAPEKCRYSDLFGIETLFFTHGLSAQQLKLLTPEKQKKFYAVGTQNILPEIPIDAGQGEFFKILKNERVGFGLAMPSLYAMFETDGAMASMITSESAYAFTGRMKFRHWKVGHIIPQGPMAGKSTYMWRPEKSKKIRDIFADKKGYLGDYVSNFDVDLEYPHEDEKFFEAKKWESPEHRLISWGGPLAMMLYGKTEIPYLAPMLFAEAQAWRRKMKTFLEEVINDAFKPPVPIKITWSNTIFNDPVIFQQFLKDALTTNVISHRTWRESVGFDNDTENARLDQQALDVAANPDKFTPPYDPAHGPNGADATAGGGGTGGNKLNRGGRGKKKTTTKSAGTN